MSAPSLTQQPCPSAALLARARIVAESVVDPEMPDITLGDMGLVRDVRAAPADEGIEIVITPSFIGCPATDIIAIEIMHALAKAGIDAVRITRALSPPWTSDWITDAGREKLRVAGIAPPPPRGLSFEAALESPVACPRCGSPHTERQSQFGSSPCKARFTCLACAEPFEQMKPV
ncbi:MAG: 1,2-phenylacetyl-CoA epoxidase subunit PaaD [Hyphomonadaceae bacterium]